MGSGGLGAAGGLAWWSGGLLGRGPVGQGGCFFCLFVFFVVSFFYLIFVFVSNSLTMSFCTASQ